MGWVTVVEKGVGGCVRERRWRVAGGWVTVGDYGR